MCLNHFPTNNCYLRISSKILSLPQGDKTAQMEKTKDHVAQSPSGLSPAGASFSRFREREDVEQKPQRAVRRKQRQTDQASEAGEHEEVIEATIFLLQLKVYLIKHQPVHDLPDHFWSQQCEILENCIK